MRQGILSLLAVGLVALPACRLMQQEPAPAEVVTHPGPGGSQFAELPRITSTRHFAVTPVVNTASTLQPVPNLVPTTKPVDAPTPEATLPKVHVPVPPIGPRVVDAAATDPPLVAAVRAYLQERPDLAVEYLKALDKPNQELLLQLIPALVRASQMPLNPARPHEIGLLIRELQAPVQQLAQRGPLLIDKAVFVRSKSVKGFGKYTPLAEVPILKPGSLADLYIEVGNVPSEPNEAEGFITHLSCSLQVVDQNGQPVPLYDRKSHSTTEVLQESERVVTRSPIRDYYVGSWIDVPNKPGSYAVVFEIRDVPSSRAVSKRIPFRVQ